MIDNENIKKIKSSILLNKKTEGWLTPHAEIIMHCLLSKLKNVENFDFLEFGSYKGKSANVLKNYLNNNKLYLVDIYNHGLDNVLCDNVVFNKLDINYLNNNNAGFIFNNKFSIIHEDTSHNIRTTLSGLNIAQKCLSNNGIYIIDDFSFWDFTVIKTVLKWLETHNDFELFLLDGVKAYLTRKETYPFWYNYCVNELQNDYTSIADRCTQLINRQNILENPTLFLCSDTIDENKQLGNYYNNKISIIS